MNFFDDIGANIDLPEFYSKTMVFDNNNSDHNDPSVRFRSGFVLVEGLIRIRSCAVTLDSDLTGDLKQDVTEIDLTVLTGFPGPWFGSAELNGAQNQAQDQANRSHRARLRFGSLQRRTLPKIVNAGQGFTVNLKKPPSFRLNSQ